SQSQLTSHTSGTAANGRDGNHRSPAQPHQRVRQGLQPGRSRWQASGVLNLCQEIVMSKEESFHGAVKNNNFNVLVSFNRCDDLIQLRNAFGAENIERRMVERYSPIMGRALLQRYPLRNCWRVGLSLGCHVESPWVRSVR